MTSWNNLLHPRRRGLIGWDRRCAHASCMQDSSMRESTSRRSTYTCTCRVSSSSTFYVPCVHVYTRVRVDLHVCMWTASVACTDHRKICTLFHILPCLAVLSWWCFVTETLNHWRCCVADCPFKGTNVFLLSFQNRLSVVTPDDERRRRRRSLYVAQLFVRRVLLITRLRKVQCFEQKYSTV